MWSLAPELFWNPHDPNPRVSGAVTQHGDRGAVYEPTGARGWMVALGGLSG